MEFRIKRIYEPASDDDGRRILVDRIWPRGVSKQTAALALWAKDCSPSHELRKWYGHDPDRWPEFRKRYFAELDAKAEAVGELETQLAGAEIVTLLFSSREPALNNAAALQEYLVARIGAGG